MANSKRIDKGESASSGMARRTLAAARFFFDQAGRVEHHSDRKFHEYYVEAAIVFAWMVVEHLGNEFSQKRGAKKWIKNLEENRPLIKELRKQRNLLSHEHPISIVPSQKEGLYSEAYEMLLDQLDEIEIIVGVCEKQFR